MCSKMLNLEYSSIWNTEIQLTFDVTLLNEPTSLHSKIDPKC